MRRMHHIMTTQEWVIEWNWLDLENVRRKRQIIGQYPAPHSDHVTDQRPGDHHHQTSSGQRIDVRGGDQAFGLWGQWHHRDENFGVAHQTLEMPLATRSCAMETRLAGIRIPHRDVSPKDSGEARIAARDIAGTDDPHLLAC